MYPDLCSDSRVCFDGIPTLSKSCLSKRLDRIPFLPDGLSADIMPQMHLLPVIDIGAGCPDLFTARILRA
jgi:hypothetical protein